MTKSPRVSFVLNTAAGDPEVSKRTDPEGRSYAERKEWVPEVLERAISEGFHEVLVVGQWHEGKDYTYLEHPPVFRTRADALWYRDYGFRASTGDIVVFSHDDHFLKPGFRKALLKEGDFDILVPRRENLDGEVLENGEDAGYMGGHVVAMKRIVPARVPWTSVEAEWWDLSLTRLWKEAGFELTFSNDLVHLAL